MARVEAFRRAHDSLHGRIAAHLTLVFPMARPAAVARRVARALSGATACRIALRGTGRYPDGSVHLRVSGGASALTALHGALGAALRAPTPRSAPAYRPHLTVARAADPRAARRLARAAASLAPLEFSVRAVSLVQEGRGGGWTEIARFRLAGPA
jgi:2'-5' RNA ligase